MVKLAIVGSREKYWKDKVGIAQAVALYVRSLPRDTVIVSGGATGIDTWAEKAAKQCGLNTIVFLPDWDADGRGATFVRNQRIADFCDELVAFWDGNSGGTKDVVNRAKKAGKKVDILRPQGID